MKPVELTLFHRRRSEIRLAAAIGLPGLDEHRRAPCGRTALGKCAA
jgi:hypothetical protein